MFTQVCVLPGAVKLAVFPLSVMIRYLEEQLRGEFSVLQSRYSFRNLYSEAKRTSLDNALDNMLKLHCLKLRSVVNIRLLFFPLRQDLSSNLDWP